MTPFDPTATQDPRVLQRVPTLLQPSVQNPQIPVAAGAAPNPVPTPPRVLPRVQAPAQQTAEPPAPSAAVQRLQQLQATRPGVENIKNPVGRTLARIGDVILGTFSPRAEALTPGTEGNYARRIAGAQRAVKAEQEGEENAARTALQRAQAHHAEAEAEGLENPGQKPITTEIGLFLSDPAKFAQYRDLVKKAETTREPQFVKGPDQEILGMIDGNGKLHSASDPNLDPQAKAMIEAQKLKPPPVKAGDEPLGDFADQMNAANQERYQVLHPGKPLPTQYKLTAKSTQKQADEIKALLGGTESAEGVKTAHEQAAATAAANRSEKNDTATRKAAYEAYKPALDAAERFNVMAKNYEDAAKGDQQAMLSLLYNHLGMTAGGQKGARLTKDLISEAERSRPWLEGMKTKFDSNGYLTGVTLSPQQMRQMVGLGRDKFAEDLAKARSEARYMGANDEGPTRHANDSVKRFYLIEAGRDPKKAQQLAAADGWTE